jgi:hypothetical protein
VASVSAWQLAGHGFTDVDIAPQIRITRDLGPATEWLLRPATEESMHTGALTEAEGTRLLDDLHEHAAPGR